MSVVPNPALAVCVHAAARGDVQAFDQLIAQVQQQLFRWALSFAKDIDDAEDIVQESSVRLYHGLSQYRGDGDVNAWLYQIVRSVGLARHRTDARRERLVRIELPHAADDV